MSELQEELYNEFQEGRFDSVQYLMNRREEIEEVTGLTVPNRAYEAENWYDSMKSTLSRKLNPDNDEGPEDGESEDGEDSEETEGDQED